MFCHFFLLAVFGNHQVFLARVILVEVNWKGWGVLVAEDLNVVQGEEGIPTGIVSKLRSKKKPTNYSVLIFLDSVSDK